MEEEKGEKEEERGVGRGLAVKAIGGGHFHRCVMFFWPRPLLLPPPIPSLLHTESLSKAIVSTRGQKEAEGSAAGFDPAYPPPFHPPYQLPPITASDVIADI